MDTPRVATLLAYGGTNGVPSCYRWLSMILASSMWEGPTPNILLPLSANIKPSKRIAQVHYIVELN